MCLYNLTVYTRLTYNDIRVRDNLTLIPYMKEVTFLVELDQFKATLNSYRRPLCEVRDSL